MAYPTLAQVKTRLGITDSSQDAKLTLILAGVIGWVENYTGRAWSGTNVVITGESHDLDAVASNLNNTMLFLNNMDIVSIQELRLGYVTPSVVPANEYKFNSRGRIVIAGRVYDNLSRAYDDYQYVSVDYTYGAAACPADLAEAIVQIACAYFATAGNASSSGSGSSGSTGGVITKERIGDYEVMYNAASVGAFVSGNSGLGAGGSVSTESIGSVRRILESYRLRRL